MRRWLSDKLKYKLANTFKFWRLFIVCKLCALKYFVIFWGRCCFLRRYQKQQDKNCKNVHRDSTSSAPYDPHRCAAHFAHMWHNRGNIMLFFWLFLVLFLFAILRHSVAQYNRHINVCRQPSQIKMSIRCGGNRLRSPMLCFSFQTQLKICIKTSE